MVPHYRGTDGSFSLAYLDSLRYLIEYGVSSRLDKLMLTLPFREIRIIRKYFIISSPVMFISVSMWVSVSVWVSVASCSIVAEDKAPGEVVKASMNLMMEGVQVDSSLSDLHIARSSKAHSPLSAVHCPLIPYPWVEQGGRIGFGWIGWIGWVRWSVLAWYCAYKNDFLTLLTKTDNDCLFQSRLQS